MLTSLRAMHRTEHLDTSTVPACVCATELAGRRCDDAGWACRPYWEALAAGAKPPDPPPDGANPGEWKHKWHFHAAETSGNQVPRRFAESICGARTRINAAWASKADIFVHGAVFRRMVIGLIYSRGVNHARRRSSLQGPEAFEIAVCFESPDPHGHARLVDGSGGRFHARHTGMTAARR